MKVEACINGRNVTMTVSAKEQAWLKRIAELTASGMHSKDAWNTASKELGMNSRIGLD